MRRTLRDLAHARKELLAIQQEFVHLRKRIGRAQDCVTDSLTRILGDKRPAMAAVAEEELIERLVGRVVPLVAQPAVDALLYSKQLLAVAQTQLKEIYSGVLRSLSLMQSVRLPFP
jgi:hypothetical protein